MPPHSTPSEVAGRAPSRERGDACPGALRLHRADDGFLARLRLPAGLLTARQVEVLGAVAERLADGRLSITSRGNVELRGLGESCGGELAALLHEAGLLPSEQHERVRNIVASPAAGLDQHGFGPVQLWARELDRLLCAEQWTAGLSGRFLFAFDDGRGDVATLGADVTLLAAPADKAVLRLGRTERRVPAAHAPRAALAAARAFLATARWAGNGAWRVRDLPRGTAAERELESQLVRFCDDSGVMVFGARILDESGIAEGGGCAGGPDGALASASVLSSEYGPAPSSARASAPSSAARLSPGVLPSSPDVLPSLDVLPSPGVLLAPDGSASVVAAAPLGRLDVAQWRALLPAPADEIRLTPWRGVLVPGFPRRAAAEERLGVLARAGLVTEPASPWLPVGACTGLPGCAKSRADVRADALPAPGPGLPVYWSGCERRCGHPQGEWVDVLAVGDGRYAVSVRGPGGVLVERSAEGPRAGEPLGNGTPAGEAGAEVPAPDKPPAGEAGAETPAAEAPSAQTPPPYPCGADVLRQAVAAARGSAEAQGITPHPGHRITAPHGASDHGPARGTEMSE